MKYALKVPPQMRKDEKNRETRAHARETKPKQNTKPKPTDF